MIRRTIILFRNPDLTQNFTEPFEKLGLSICCIPVLEFDYERYQNHLRNTNFEAAKGIIFPSQRAVIALSRLNLDLKHLKWYTVGESTGRLCQELLYKIPETIGIKGASELADEITTDQSLIGNCLIYLSGDNQSTLPFEKFANANIHINEVCCYGTVSVSKESFLSSWNFEDKPLACVFFSPSGVRTVTSYLENLEWESVKVFAIGETTANALLSQTPINRCDGVPSQFNLEGIKSMLLQYFNH